MLFKRLLQYATNLATQTLFMLIKYVIWCKCKVAKYQEANPTI